jgi:hypothetical protein
MSTDRRTDRVVAWARGLTERQVLLHLGGAHVVLALLLLVRVWHLPVIGDEAQYVDGAKALGNLVRDWGALRSPDTVELERSVVASGWFMPGMSVVLAPLYLLVPDAPIGVARAYLAVFHTLLFFAAVRATYRTFGHRYAAALLVFPGLVPLWILFGSGAWGDLAAGMLVVLLLCEVVTLYRGFLLGRAPGWGDGLRFGLLAIATLYLRASAVPLLAGLFALFLLGLVVFLRGRVRLRAAGALLLAVAAFVAVLLPWSLFASQTLGSRVVTTTTLPTVLAQSFGDREQTCYGPCDPGSTLWFAPVRYARETSRSSGVGEAVVLEQMSAYALRDVTLTGYARDVGAGFGRYTLQVSGYEFWFRPGSTRHVVGPIDVVTPFLHAGTWLLYGPAALCGLAGMFAVTRGPRDRQLTLVAVKLFTAALLLFPFVHVGSSRYWPTYAPLLAFAAVLLWEMRRDRGRYPVADGPLETWLFRVQVLLSALTGFVAVALMVLSLLDVL